MDGLGDIGSFLSGNWQKLLTGGLFGAGEVGNILEARKRDAYQDFVMNILKHPEILAQMAAKIQQPLSMGLTQAVNNKVQADMASRGLAQAPGIFAGEEAQALAPFVQQNQQTAMNAVLSSLGLPAGTFGNPTNNTGALQLFLNSFKNKAGTGGAPSTSSSGGIPGFTFPTDTVNDLGG